MVKWIIILLYLNACFLNGKCTPEALELIAKLLKRIKRLDDKMGSINFNF
jgi:hypothetical protein